MNQLGANWCYDFLGIIMPARKRRFTVSLDERDYEALREIGATQRPPLKLQYLVELAIRNLLDQYGNDQLTLGLK